MQVVSGERCFSFGRVPLLSPRGTRPPRLKTQGERRGWGCLRGAPNPSLPSICIFGRGFSAPTHVRASILEHPPPEAPQTTQRYPRLLSKLVSAHAASVTALHVLTDMGEEKLVVSGSLDKSLCTWKLTNCKQTVPPGTARAPDGPPLPPLLDAYGNPKLEVQVVRLRAPRAPVFSIVRQPCPAVGSVFSPSAEVLFCGNAAKEMFAWEVKPCLLDEPCPANFQMVATEYSGWVRSLAIAGKWLISCGCNSLHLHDTSFPLPKEVSNIEQAYKGDILTIAVGNNRVFAGCADGYLRSWSMNSKTGALTLGPHLYSISLDGCIRVWRTHDLVCVAEVKAAHDGMKIHAIALGPDNVLYTGGDDKLIRRWLPLSLHPAFPADSWPPAPPVKVSPSVSVNAATGEVTSNLPSSSDSDGLDSRDCDLGGGSTGPSREASPVGDSAGAARAAAASGTDADGPPGDPAGAGNSRRAGGGGGDMAGDAAEAGASSLESVSNDRAEGAGALEVAGLHGGEAGGASQHTGGNTGCGTDEHGGPQLMYGERLLELEPAPGGPLAAHEAGLRCLAVGSNQALVSGDAKGDLCIWATHQPEPRPA